MKNIHNNDIYKNQASVIGKRKRDINGENELNQKVKKIKSDNFSGKRKRENDAQTKNEKRFKKRFSLQCFKSNQNRTQTKKPIFR